METYGTLDAGDARLAAREDAFLARENAFYVIKITEKIK